MWNLRLDAWIGTQRAKINWINFSARKGEQVKIILVLVKPVLNELIDMEMKLGKYSGKEMRNELYVDIEEARELLENNGFRDHVIMNFLGDVQCEIDQ